MPGKHISDISIHRANNSFNPEPPNWVYINIRWTQRLIPFGPPGPRVAAFELTSAQLTSLARAVNRAVKAGQGKLRVIDIAGYFGWTWYREED